jgi:hypothetical protein
VRFKTTAFPTCDRATIERHDGAVTDLIIRTATGADDPERLFNLL